MKTSVRLLILSAALAAGAHAAPFLAVSDNSEVFLTGKLGVRQDSNIFLTHNAVSDTIWDIDPGFQFVFGNTSAAKGTFSATENLTAYSSHSDLNTNLLSSAFDIAYEDGKTKASFDASYDELNQNTYNINGSGSSLTTSDLLIRRNVTDVGTKGEVAVTEKTSVGAGVTFGRTDYRLKAFSDADVLTIPLNYFYEVTPKLEASAGYTYRATWQQLYADSVDNFYNVGVRGEITPKLSGTINAGLTDRRFSGKYSQKYNLGSASLFGVSSNLTYTVSPKATIQFGIDNDFDTNAQGRQEKDLSANIGGILALAEDWTVDAKVTWRSIHYANNDTSYPDHKDTFWDTSVGVTYKVNAVVGITASVAYRKNDSGQGTGETSAIATSRSFEQNVFSLAANFRY